MVELCGWVAGAVGGSAFRRWGVSPLWSGALVGLLWTVAPRPLPMALAWFGVLLAAIDLEHRRLPDVLTLPLYPVVAVLCAHEWRKALIGCAAFGGVHLVTRLVNPRAMGGGDVKLAGALGAALAVHDWFALVWATGLASAVTLAISVVTRRREAPHGPGLLAVTWWVTAL
ncbi:prepilin peptidase [Lentzea tibetensis]|nr:A24 family peptidase [Lentzea tibetensis]